MNLYAILFFLLIVNTIFCCESWFKINRKHRGQHIFKKNLHKNRSNNGLINLFQIPKHTNIRRKEKSINKKKSFNINNSGQLFENFLKTFFKKQSKKYNLAKKKNIKVKINNLKQRNNKINKGLKLTTKSFVKNVFNLPKFINKNVKNKKMNKKSNNKIQKNKFKQNKNIVPKIFINETKNVDELINTSKLNCIENNDCINNNECGSYGTCYNGKCRCSCIEFSSCISNDDCPGSNSKCYSKCIGKNGTTVDCGISFNKRFKYYDEKSYCSIGSQCLSGICIGGGRKKILNGIEFYEAISCSTTSEDISCKGIGTENCTSDDDLIFRHTDESFIGTKKNISITNMHHIKLNSHFPTCYSVNDDFIKCGEEIDDSCIEGSYCGYCKC